MTRYELEKIIKERFNELEDAIIYRLHDLSEFKYDKEVKNILFEIFLDPEKTNITIMFHALDANFNDIEKSKDKNSFASSMKFVSFKFYRKKITEELFQLGMNEIIENEFCNWFSNCWNKTKNVNLKIDAAIMFHDGAIKKLITNK